MAKKADHHKLTSIRIHDEFAKRIPPEKLALSGQYNMLSLNVDWLDKHPINMTGDVQGFCPDLGEPILIKPLDARLAVDHEVFPQDAHTVLGDDSPSDHKTALLGILLDMRLNADA